jgi:hypothetical protein
MHGAKKQNSVAILDEFCVRRNGLRALLRSWDLGIVISGGLSSLLIAVMFFLYFFLVSV